VAALVRRQEGALTRLDLASGPAASLLNDIIQLKRLGAPLPRAGVTSRGLSAIEKVPSAGDSAET